MIDPTFAAQVRAMLKGVASDHPSSTEGVCACGDELDPERPFEAHLLDEIAELVVEPPVKPHRVKVAASHTQPYEEIVQSEAQESDPRPKGTRVKGAIYSGPLDCPDCGRGLESRTDGLWCSRLGREVQVAGSGGLVACGVKFDG